MEITKYYSIPFYGKGSITNRQKLVDKSNKYPNGYFKDKKCRLCDKEFKPYSPSHHYCSDECTELARADAYYYRNYKISIFQYYDIYMKNNGKCYICNSEGFTLSWNNPTTSLALDHDHKTGKARGMLCHNCNRALGLFNDSLDTLKKAIDYLNTDLDIDDNDRSNRVFRNRGNNSANKLSKEDIFNIYDMKFNQNLVPSVIAEKVNISANMVTGILKGNHHKKLLIEWNNLNNRKCNDYPEMEYTISD
ncbi:hypothetical protein C0959_00155 [Campylobacter coli]|uniref:endonuclease VII domain-containing protein n=1 Tax=Campylobacter coli TaxID=195 RepID=UPI0009A5D4BC|nr:endonuclease VII domain-containing protein [Campylobacter coli]EAK2897013.1 hypothetical protein [Campylobacter coli]